MRAPFALDSETVEALRGYSHSRAGQRRGIIAEAEWNPYDYEDVDQWPTAKVNWWFHRMEGTAAFREQHREEMGDGDDDDGWGSPGQSGGGGSVGMAQWATENDVDFQELDDGQQQQQ